MSYTQKHLVPSYIVQNNGLGNVRETDIVVNMDNFTVNADYIPVAVNPKTFTIRPRYSNVALFLHYT